MGVVYRAVEPEYGQDVALKVLPAELAVQPDKLERFRREARHGVKLRHRNIVRVHEFGEANGTFFLVLDYVDGIDLHQLIQEKKRLDPKEALRIVLQAARALNYLHKHGMVHRDIKPSNFLLAQEDGELVVKLTDLGLSREVNEEEYRVTREGNTVGTVDYMAPEQARDSGMADIRSDIYALGCTWFHMLAGHPPFQKGGMIERLYQHIEAEPPDVRTINAEVPPKQAAVLLRMMAKKPAARYQTPAELLQDLLRARPRRPRPRPPKKLPAPPPETVAADSEGPGSATPSDLTAASESDSLPGVTADQRRAAAGQYERAKEVLGSGNHDYAIHLLLSCCKLDPANLTYRKALRRAEKIKFGNNLKGRPFSWLTSLPSRTRLKGAKRLEDHLKVLESGEEVLAQNPWDVAAQLDMAEAADALGLFKLATWLLEEALDKDALNPTVNRALALLYEGHREYRKAAAHWDLLRKADPSNAEAAQKVTDLAAKDTIARVGADAAARRAKRKAHRQ
jgi:serine/threonine-protein kinase